MLDRIFRSLQILEDRRFAGRVLLTFSSLFGILIPVLVALTLFLYDLFSQRAKLVGGEEMVNWGMSSILKGTILGFIFSLGMILILVGSHGTRRLDFVVILVCLTLVLASIGVNLIVTNRCLTDMKCDSTLYLVSIGIMGVLSAAAIGFCWGIGRLPVWFSILWLLPLMVQTYHWLIWLAGHALLEIGPDIAQSILLYLITLAFMLVYAAAGSRIRPPAAAPN